MLMNGLEKVVDSADEAVGEMVPVSGSKAAKGRTDLIAVSFPDEFREGARNAVTTCLRIRSEEKVTLITDRSCLAIAASIAAELEQLGCVWNAFVLEELAPRPLVGMPAEVLEDMESSQVSIFAVEVQPNELRSRMEMTDVVNRRRMRTL
jgi:aminopeptidase